MQVTKWTVTSPAGQKLEGELENGNVNISSVKGNHGQVELSVWLAKIDQMVKAGYILKTE